MVERETVRSSGMAEKGIREHEFEGIKMHLKVARYETHGVKRYGTCSKAGVLL